MRVAPEIVLTDDERRELVRLVRSRLTSVRGVQRARIVLLAADGKQNKDIAVTLAIGLVQVARWRERYRQQQLAGSQSTARSNRAGGSTPLASGRYRPTVSACPRHVAHRSDLV